MPDIFCNLWQILPVLFNDLQDFLSVCLGRSYWAGEILYQFYTPLGDVVSHLQSWDDFLVPTVSLVFTPELGWPQQPLSIIQLRAWKDEPWCVIHQVWQARLFVNGDVLIFKLLRRLKAGECIYHFLLHGVFHLVTEYWIVPTRQFAASSATCAVEGLPVTYVRDLRVNIAVLQDSGLRRPWYTHWVRRPWRWYTYQHLLNYREIRKLSTWRFLWALKNFDE